MELQIKWYYWRLTEYQNYSDSSWLMDNQLHLTAGNKLEMYAERNNSGTFARIRPLTSVNGVRVV
jgi:hypothetical protein